MRFLPSCAGFSLPDETNEHKDGSSEETYNVTPQAFFVENPWMPSRESLP